MARAVLYATNTAIANQRDERGDVSNHAFALGVLTSCEPVHPTRRRSKSSALRSF